MSESSTRELRDEEKVLEREACNRNVSSELGQVVLVGFSDLLDDAVQAKALEESGDLRGAEALEVVSETAVAEAVDEELAATEDLEERLIVVIEEVEAAVAMVVFLD